MGEITCQHDDIAKAFSALSRPVWEFFIALMAKQIILKVKLVQNSSNMIVNKVIFTWRIFFHILLAKFTVNIFCAFFRLNFSPCREKQYVSINIVLIPLSGNVRQ